MFRPQVSGKKTIINLYNTLAFPALLYGSEDWTIKNKRLKKNNSSRDETYEKNSRTHLDRL